MSYHGQPLQPFSAPFPFLGIVCFALGATGTVLTATGSPIKTNILIFYIIMTILGILGILYLVVVIIRKKNPYFLKKKPEEEESPLSD